MSGPLHNDEFQSGRAAGHAGNNGGPIPGDGRALIAVDLGAESCRISLLRWIGDRPEISVVHRFTNGPGYEGETLRWNIAHICTGVEEGLRKCAAIASEGIASLGIDGWAVDYVRLDAQGYALANPFCYRDERTVMALEQVHQRISTDRLYRLTGAQILPLNTLYQLWADAVASIPASTPWINLPEYVMYRLGGLRVSEFTNATHTEMLDARDQSWSKEIFSAVGFDMEAAPPVVKPGTDIGRLQGPLSSLAPFHDTRLIAPACHDTASAIAGIPAQGSNWAFISSGTWSLVGCVLDSPHISDEARNKNFSNEGGVGGKTYFLKNVNGMWPLRQCMNAWQEQGAAWTLDALLEACNGLDAPEFLLHVDDPDLLLPGDMLSRINAQLTRAGRAAIPEELGAAPLVANLIFHSLAARYATVLNDAANVTGSKFTHLYIVGGGSKNTLLNRLTERTTGMIVVTGPAESATIGNFAVQLAALTGQYDEEIGVSHAAVTKFAHLLAEIQVVPILQDAAPALKTVTPGTRPEPERLSG